MKELVYLLKLSQKDLKEYLYNYLKDKNMNPLNEDGFLYVEGNIPVLLVAHMDTVDINPPKEIIYNEEVDLLYNPDGILGGDDRCGIYAILKLLEQYRPYILFTEDEEIGCVGAKKAVLKISKPDVKYIIEFDRAGKDDCVFYECDNKSFINYVEKYGFKIEEGTYSDISILGKSWNIASVNLSSGYYNEHTKDEYVILNELEKTIERAEDMIESIDKAPYYKHSNDNKFTSLHKIYELLFHLKNDDNSQGDKSWKK